MSHSDHDLHAAFPADGDVLHALKLSSTHYQRLSDQYYDLDRSIHRIETDIEPASEAHLEELKKQRLAVLDEVAGLVAQAKAAVD